MSVDEPTTILLVEDDAADAAELSALFSTNGCTVWHAETASDGRAMLKEQRPDLIVLDLTLPDVDGLVFCTHLKTDAPDVPFMICSQGTTAEKILAFKLGAEDFVTKPFESAEVEVRVETILRRTARLRALQQEREPRPLRTVARTAPGSALLRVDLARWRISLDDQPLDLTPTEFQLLVFMARRHGEIISRPELARGVWGDESMSRSRTIDAYVRRISSKLSAGGAQRILSIRGLGYQLAVPMATAA
jgi:DNA-binding response OmpR family regulator